MGYDIFIFGYAINSLEVFIYVAAKSDYPVDSFIRARVCFQTMQGMPC